MPARAAVGSPLDLLERSDVGLVQLDLELRILAMNACARRLLPAAEPQSLEGIVLAFQPDPSQPKVKVLLEQAECPGGDAPPMTLVIDVAQRVLLMKVSKLSDLLGDGAGYALLLYDITAAAGRDEAGPARAGARRQVQKIPTVAGNRIILVDAGSVRFVRAEGHYTWVHTAQGSSFCNLTIGDLEARVDPRSFLRIHRSYLANLDFAEEIVRDDGKVTLKLGGDRRGLPVARASVPRLLERLGITDPDVAG